MVLLVTVGWFFTGNAASAQQWLVDANTRIELHRKADLTVEVVDSLGNPVPNADVHVEMKRHTFGFGTAVTAGLINDDSPTGVMYRQKLLENFNQVVFENDLKWPAWNGAWGGFSWSQTQQALNWLDANGLPARGHYLSWATEANGADYDGGDNDHSTLETRLYNHITDIMQTTQGRVFEWDVINHPVGWTGNTYENDPDINEGTDIFKQIVDHARSVAAADPNIPNDLPMWINEDDVIRGGGWRANDYERIIQYLVDNGSTPDGIGFQAHFIDVWGGITTDYQVIYVYNVKRTNMFSHGDMEAITMWGFWEGSVHNSDIALYENNWTEKPSLTAYQNLVFGDWWTDAMGTSDGQGKHTLRAFKGLYDVTVSWDSQDYQLSDYALEGDDTVQIQLADVTLFLGDFDFDGDVDGEDFLIWQRDPSVGSLTDWETNYGSVAGLPLSAAVSVPEPYSSMLALAVWLALTLNARACLPNNSVIYNVTTHPF